MKKKSGGLLKEITLKIDDPASIKKALSSLVDLSIFSFFQPDTLLREKLLQKEPATGHLYSIRKSRRLRGFSEIGGLAMVGGSLVFGQGGFKYLASLLGALAIPPRHLAVNAIRKDHKALAKTLLQNYDWIRIIMKTHPIMSVNAKREIVFRQATKGEMRRLKWQNGPFKKRRITIAPWRWRVDLREIAPHVKYTPPKQQPPIPSLRRFRGLAGSNRFNPSKKRPPTPPTRRF